MLSSSSRYGIRAVIYLAGRPAGKEIVGITTIAKDLDLPTPFLAKILQQLAKNKILHSIKGPHGGFSIMKDPAEISLFDIVRIIEGDEIFTNCIIHNASCHYVDKHKLKCVLHDDYSSIRKELIRFFRSNTIYDIVKKTGGYEKYAI